MRLRDLLLAACLLSCPLAGTSLAQQAASAPEVAPQPEPHPAPAAPAAGPAVYNVEVIIFRTTATLGSPENWSAEAAQAPAVPLAADGETAPAGDAAGNSGGTPAQPPGSRFVRVLTPAEFQFGGRRGAPEVQRHLCTGGPWGLGADGEPVGFKGKHEPAATRVR